MYSNPVKNDAWYQPPEPTGMTDEQFDEAMSQLINDPDSVRDAIFDVFGSELFKLFHVEHNVAFHELLREKVLSYFRVIVELGDNDV